MTICSEGAPERTGGPVLQDNIKSSGRNAWSVSAYEGGLFGTTGEMTYISVI